jgi:hypothetical protein
MDAAGGAIIGAAWVAGGIASFVGKGGNGQDMSPSEALIRAAKLSKSSPIVLPLIVNVNIPYLL